MAHSVYTAIIDLGDVDLEDIASTEEALNTALFDLLDESGLRYRAITAQVVDSDTAAKKADGVIGKLATPADNQLGGFRQSDPETSRKAAVLNYPRSGSQRWKALLAITTAANGLTGQEVAEETDLEYRSITPRLAELKHGGWIEESGKTRKTNLNAEAIVLVATDKGRRYVEHKEGIAI